MDKVKLKLKNTIFFEVVLYFFSSNNTERQGVVKCDRLGACF